MKSRYFNVAGILIREADKHSVKIVRSGYVEVVEAGVERAYLQALRCQDFLATAEAEAGRVNSPPGRA